MEKNLSLAEVKAIGGVRYSKQPRNFINATTWVLLAFLILGSGLFFPSLVKNSYPVEYTTQQGDVISLQHGYATFNGELMQKTRDCTLTPLGAAGITLGGIGVIGVLVVLVIEADREIKARNKFAQQWLDNNLEIPK